MLCGRDGLDARLIRRYHVLYVYERIDPAAHLEKIQRLLDHLPDVPEVALRLGVVHLVAQITLLRFEEVQPGGSVRGEHANSTGLVLGCIETKFVRKYALESSHRDLHNALLCTVL